MLSFAHEKPGYALLQRIEKNHVKACAWLVFLKNDLKKDKAVFDLVIFYQRCLRVICELRTNIISSV
jgi:hypothetical protein